MSIFMIVAITMRIKKQTNKRIHKASVMVVNDIVNQFCNVMSSNHLI